MTLQEQLDELRNNILRDRSDIITGSGDELWSDDTLLRYIKDAERRFARRTFCLRDATTPAITQLTLQTGVVSYTLHETVFSVLSARYDTRPYDMVRTGHGILFGGQRPEVDIRFDHTIPYTIPPGAPDAYYTDESLVNAGKNRLSIAVYPAPSTDANGKKVYLRTMRVPRNEYSVACLSRESEIPEDYQLDVLEWAAYRALRTFDADAGAPTTAADHQKAFEDSATRAIRELKSRMFANLGMGYGRNGWTWESGRV